MEGDRISPLEDKWTATDSRWNRYVVSLVSSVTAVIRRPSSCTNSTAQLFLVPAVSMATGTKMWLLASCLYLLEAALSAAAPAVVAVSASVRNFSFADVLGGDFWRAAKTGGGHTPGRQPTQVFT